MLAAVVSAQEGYVHLKGEETWIIQLNDMTFQAGDTLLVVAEGKSVLTARPLLNYSWPGILLKDTLNVRAADTLLVELNAARARPVAARKADTMTVNRPYSPTFERETPAWRGKVKTGLIITAVAGNWLSFYLKRQADDAYDRYRSASDLGRINDAYDKTLLYDDLSAATLGIATAALSAYIYLELTDD